MFLAVNVIMEGESCQALYLLPLHPPEVRYLPDNQSFSADNLEVSIVLNGEEVMWSPTPAVNASLNGNLLGTIRVSYCFLQSLGLFHNM